MRKAIVTKFMKIFEGRKDCFGSLEGLCNHEEVTKATYKSHLLGRMSIGIYPLRDDGTTSFGVIDDDHEDLKTVTKIYEYLKELKLVPYVEKSKSKGYHVWVLFDTPIVAKTLRNILKHVTTKAGKPTLEIFPKQDELGKIGESIGNYINLPYYREHVKEGKRVMLNMENQKEPLSLEVFLENVKLNTFEQLERIEIPIEQHSNIPMESIKPSETSGGIKSKLPCIEIISNGVDKGIRNEAMFNLAKHLKYKMLPKEKMLETLLETNKKNRPPMDDSEIVRIVDSVIIKEYKSISCDKLKEFCKGTCVFKNNLNLTIPMGWKAFRIMHGLRVESANFIFKFTNLDITRQGVKATIEIIKDGSVLNKDNVLFSSAQTRTKFVNACDLEEEKAKELQKELIMLESILNEYISNKNENNMNEKVILTDEERNKAIEWLKDKELLFKIKNCVRKLGVVGESKNILTGYIATVSRKRKKPISITVKGESSSGKNYLMERILKLVPKEDYQIITEATGQSFYYLDIDLRHKIIMIAEVEGIEKANYSIRSLQSEGKLSINVTVKNPTTGKMEVESKIVEGPVMFIQTTTQPLIYADNETRNLSVFIDESEKQTERIYAEIASRYEYEREKISDEKLVQLQNMQRVLNDFDEVIIPFGRQITKRFPLSYLRGRRDLEKVTEFIVSSALLHQYQRETKVIEGKTYLIASIADYYITKRLIADSLAKTMLELPKKTIEIIELAKERTKKGYPLFTYRSLAKLLGWKYEVTKKWTLPAFNSGYFDISDDNKKEGADKREKSFRLTDMKLKIHKILPSVKEVLEEMNLDERKKAMEVPIYDPINGEEVTYEEIMAE